MANVKVCLLGDSNVGKTTIKGNFVGLDKKIDYAATIGADFTLKVHNYKSNGDQLTINYTVYDLAGQQGFKEVRSQFMLGSNAAILVYDISDRKSFDSIVNWLTEFKKVVNQHVPLVIVGNKIDLRDKGIYGLVTTKEGEVLVSSIRNNFENIDGKDIFFIETSATENIKIQETFDLISKWIYDEHIKTRV